MEDDLYPDLEDGKCRFRAPVQTPYVDIWLASLRRRLNAPRKNR